VLFAPGARDLDTIRELVSSVDLPVNVLVLPGMPTVAELAETGVSRISVGGAFAFAAFGAAAAAGRELMDSGTYGYWETAAGGAKATREAFKR
jgi:2-methylisocitrate lyase-like PEP mutase family enzyme